MAGPPATRRRAAATPTSSGPCTKPCSTASSWNGWQGWHPTISGEISALVGNIIEDERILLNDSERKQLCGDVYDEMFDSARWNPCCGSDRLRYSGQHRQADLCGATRQAELTDVTFYDDAHLMKVIEKIVSRVGRRIDETSPMVDARLPDGSRVNAIIPPSAIDGPLLSIRRFATSPLQVSDLIEYRSLTAPMAQLLQALAHAKINVLVSGGTGSGKTTLLNILSGFIPDSERVVTIEDAAELQLRQPHVLRLETRPPNIEGKGEITQRALVRNALRMRPDRIILGEVRGGEALDMLNAMNTGHEGSLTTIHANTPRDALTRLENMVSMAGLSLPPKAIRQQIASAITVIVQASRLTDGRRKIISIQEITGMEGDMVNMQEIFTFQRSGVLSDGAVKGHFRATGVYPKFAERLRVFGVGVPTRYSTPTGGSKSDLPVHAHHRYRPTPGEGKWISFLRIHDFAVRRGRVQHRRNLYLVEQLSRGFRQTHRGSYPCTLGRRPAPRRAVVDPQGTAAEHFADTAALAIEPARIASTDRWLEQSGSNWSVAQLFGYSGLCMLCVLALAPVLPSPSPWSCCSHWWRARSRCCAWSRCVQTACASEQLPDAVDMISRSLRAGHSFSGALGMVGEEMKDPMGREFRLTFDEINYGCLWKPR